MARLPGRTHGSRNRSRRPARPFSFRPRLEVALSGITGARAKWIEGGLVEGATRAIVAGLAMSGQLVAPLLPRARKEGLLEDETPADLAAASIDILYVSQGLKPERTTGRAIATDPGLVALSDLDRVLRWVRKVMADPLIDLQSKTLDEPFLAASEEVVKTAAVEKWSRERFRSQIEELASRFGADNFRGSYADTWYRTIVLNGSYNRALLLAYNTPPTSRLFPYIAVRTIDDSVRRPEHGALEGFVARSNWKGWRRYLPPLGFNCRCRGVPVSYAVARALGWIGKDFPRGDDFLKPRTGPDGKRIVPGHSPGFVEPLAISPDLLVL